jgi:hypothetical protein
MMPARHARVERSSVAAVLVLVLVLGLVLARNATLVPCGG